MRKCASLLQDEKLLAKLSAGDLVALEAKYHAFCLALLYKKAARDEEEEDEMKMTRPEGITLAELVLYIEESSTTSAAKLPLFKLFKLVKSTHPVWHSLVKTTPRTHTTRLKNYILSHIPTLEEHKQGRVAFLAFKKDLANVLQKAQKEDCHEEAIHLAKAASIVHKNMLAKKYTFDGSFEHNCKVNSVPATLIS